MRKIVLVVFVLALISGCGSTPTDVNGYSQILVGTWATESKETPNFGVLSYVTEYDRNGRFSQYAFYCLGAEEFQLENAFSSTGYWRVEGNTIFTSPYTAEQLENVQGYSDIVKEGLDGLGFSINYVEDTENILSIEEGFFVSEREKFGELSSYTSHRVNRMEPRCNN